MLITTGLPEAIVLGSPDYAASLQNVASQRFDSHVILLNGKLGWECSSADCDSYYFKYYFKYASCRDVHPQFRNTKNHVVENFD